MYNILQKYFLSLPSEYYIQSPRPLFHHYCKDVLYSENSSNAFRRLRRRPAPKNLSGFAANFDNFKFFYESIITHYSKFFKKNKLEKLIALAANSFSSAS